MSAGALAIDALLHGAAMALVTEDAFRRSGVHRDGVRSSSAAPTGSISELCPECFCVTPPSNFAASRAMVS